jgi:hypothetical protein
MRVWCFSPVLGFSICIIKLTSLSDTGVLEYEIGSDKAKETYFRVVANTAGVPAGGMV